MKNFLLFKILFFTLLNISLQGQCNYTLKMDDSYGDGWNGNTIDVLVNGSVVLDDVTLSSGTTQSLPIPVNTGDAITTIWNGGGSYGAETSYEILDSSGNVVGSAAQSNIDTPINVNCPSCPTPTNLTASNIDDISADFSWTAGGNEMSWNVEYGLTGYTQGSGTLVNGITNPFSLSGLTATTEYDYYVQADCDSDGTSDWSGPYSFTTSPPPPANDECDNAISLTVNADYNCGTVTAGTTSGASASSQADDVTGTPNTDVWFSFVATSTGHRVTLTNIVNQGGGTSASTDMGMGVYDATSGCSSLTLQDDSDPNTLDLTGLTVGTTYLVRVYGWYSSVQYNNFDICVGTQPACPDPSALTATNITINSADLGWTVGGSETSWNLEWGTSGFAQGSGTLVNGVSNPYALSGLTTATEYQYYVQADCTADGTSDWEGPFAFTTLSPPPSNDECVNAKPLDCATNTSYTGETTIGATDAISNSCVGSQGNNVWYVFNGNDQTITIELTSNTSGQAGQIDIYESTDGTCDNITCLEGASSGSGENPAEATFIATSGKTYYISIGNWISSGNDFDFDISVSCSTCVEPTFTVAAGSNNCPTEEFFVDVDVTDLGSGSSVDVTDGTSTLTAQSTGTYSFGPYAASTALNFTVSDNADSNCSATASYTTPSDCPPSNDECANAKPLDCTTNTSYTGETTVGSTDNGDAIGCTTLGNGIWYKFNGEGTITVTSQAGAGFDHEMAVATSTDCTSFTKIDCSDGAGTAGTETIEFVATAGIDYYIYVGHYASNSTGTFDISVSCSTCVEPTFTVANGGNNCPTEEFFVDVDVTDLGSGSSVDVTDGTTTLTAQSTGTYTFGPYAASTAVNFTVSDNADNNCSATASYTTPATCPPACGGKFYDSGGATGDYTNNENITTTICPDNSGDVVTVTFVSFDTEESYDFLNIYDGNDATGNNLGQFSGTSNPGSFTSTATDGCLTFVFTSDGSFTKAGWEADVTCTPACNAPDNISLAPSTMTLSPSNTCDESGMTYYGDGNGSYFFAINWGTANNDAKNAASVSITTGAMGSEEDTNASVPEATYTMGRYWNVDLNGQSLSEDVSVRFYYDAAEKTAVETMASDFVTANASEGTVAQDGKWFKTVGMDFDHTAINATAPGQGAIELSATEGMQDGVDYVEFTVSSFSGGTFATGAGVSGSSLPIELLSFNAREKGAVNMITWSTASEINTKEMMIQASPDGKAWKEIGKVESRGSERTGSEYEIVDNDPYFKTYYRIVTEDFDGSIERSRIVYVTRKDDSAGWKVSIAPNPTQHNTILNFDSYRSENIVVSVIDMTGKLVSQTKHKADKGLNQYEIDLADQSSGLYIVKISSDSRSETLRVSKM